jgi:hypothetical protein
MKKIFVLSVALFALVSFAKVNGQATFNKGDKAINLGVGLVALGANASVEFGVQKNLGVGAYFAYERVSTGLIGSALGVNYGYNVINLGLRGAYHFSELLNMNDGKFDFYGAGGVGVRLDRGYATDYNVLTGKYTYGTRIFPQLLIRAGGRYYFSDKMAGWAELGTGGSWIQGGIAFKF